MNWEPNLRMPLGEEVTHMLRVALDNEVRRYKMSARKLTVLTVR